MESHVKILAVLHLVFGGLGVLAAIAIFAIFGGLAALVGSNSPIEDARVAVPILGVIGVVIALFVVIISVPRIVAGVGLLCFAAWARILTIVLSALELVEVPFGTALGAYGLWVLLSGETERLFMSRVRPMRAA